jgi:uncharacterized protein YecE (DUF72 family)
MLRIGTAGWAIRREHRDRFPGEGSHLARYSAQLNAVEINSSFYRPHRPATYTKWARETPDIFSFAVKMPRAITHTARLKDSSEALTGFFGECGALGEKLGCVLIQLPPSLAFEEAGAKNFFDTFREIYPGATALEPRHASWFAPEAEAMLVQFEIARVAADPVPAKIADAARANEPGGFRGFAYWRLHGSPRIYYSDYDSGALTALAQRLSPHDWCIFDNTALGHATSNALELRAQTR